MAHRDHALKTSATMAERTEPRGSSAMVITSNFPSDASVGTMRTLRLVRHLADTGWSVDVVTAMPEGFRPGTVIDPALVETVPADVRVVRARALRPVERLGAAIRPRQRPAERAAVRPATPSQAQRPASRLRRFKQGLAVRADGEHAIGEALRMLVRRSGGAFSGVDSRYFDSAARAADTKRILFELSRAANRMGSLDPEPAVASASPPGKEGPHP